MDLTQETATVSVQLPVRAAKVAARVRARTRIQRQDVINLWIIALAWALLIVLISPEHDYPVVDDWIYAGSVRDMMNTGTFVMPGWSQANLIGLVLWGLLWVKLFGFTLTVLTYSTLVLGLGGLFAFYGICRRLDVTPWGALLCTG